VAAGVKLLAVTPIALAADYPLYRRRCISPKRFLRIDNRGIGVFISGRVARGESRFGGTVGREPAEALTWHQGRPCHEGGCVEIAVTGEDVLVRTTVFPDAPIRLTRDEWSAFLASAKEGHFDHL
jgi:hypothetical protein